VICINRIGRSPEIAMFHWQQFPNGARRTLGECHCISKKEQGGEDSWRKHLWKIQLFPTSSKKNRLHQHVSIESIAHDLHLDVPRRTINNYTLENNFTSKKTKIRKFMEVSDGDDDVLGKFIVKTWDFERKAIVVFDEKPFLSNSIPRTGLSLKGKTPYIHMAKEIFPLRIDLLHAVCTDGFLADPLFLTPRIRRTLKTKGIKKIHVLGWLENDLFPAIRRRGIPHVGLMFDQATVHSPGEIDDLFADLCPDNYGGTLVQPVGLAKFVSPLDNGVHAYMEGQFRKRLWRSDQSEESTLNCLMKTYEEIPADYIRNYFNNCAIGN